MNVKLVFFIAIIGLALYSIKSHAQVTIGSSEKPLEGALLDLKENSDGSSTRGLLLPRVALKSLDNLGQSLESDTTDYDPISHIGLLVYNVRKGPCSGYYPGVYTWQGDKWVLVSEPYVESTSSDQYTGANSYVVARGNTVKIPVKRGYEIWRAYQVPSGTNATDQANIDAGTVLTLSAVNNLIGDISGSIAWEENGSSVIESLNVEGVGEDAVLSVKASAVKEGNALIQAIITNGGNAKVLWQWHIWVTDSNPASENSKTYCYNGNEFMAQNLGAKNSMIGNPDSYGLLYQWGRHIPIAMFGTVTKRQDVMGDRSKNLAYAIQSDGFIINSIDYNLENVPHDWYSRTKTGWDDRWGATGDKSAFDPCPEGWRIPQYVGWASPWYGITTPSTAWNAGWNFTDTDKNIGYYPATGYRFFGNGQTVTKQGVEGYYWTAQTNKDAAFKTNAFCLQISATGIVINQNIPYADAFAVRCVRE